MIFDRLYGAPPRYRPKDHYPHGLPLFSRTEIKRTVAWCKRTPKKSVSTLIQERKEDGKS